MMIDLHGVVKVIEKDKITIEFGINDNIILRTVSIETLVKHGIPKVDFGDIIHLSNNKLHKGGNCLLRIDEDTLDQLDKSYKIAMSRGNL